jgi:hypothetical protein
MAHFKAKLNQPFRFSSAAAERSRVCEVAGGVRSIEPSFLDLLARGRGDMSAGVSVNLSDSSEYFSDGGVSISGVEENAPGGMSPLGRSGSDLLRPLEAGVGFLFAFLFFRRRAMRLS